MSDRALRKLAAGLFALSLLIGIGGLVLKGDLDREDLFGIPSLAFCVVGAVVSIRQPRNPIGWLFMLVGFTPMMGFASSEYAVRNAEAAGNLPGALLMEWVSVWAWFPGIASLITFVLLLFPDGRLPSSRWRPVSYLAAGVNVLATACFAFLPGRMEPFSPRLRGSINPVGIDGVDLVLPVAFMLVPVVGVSCAASLLFRYRAAGVQQRQQIKWFAFSALVLVVILLFDGIFSDLLGANAAEVIFLLGMTFPSVAAGIGILKYRLYDIDVVINRTLVYGVLTVILAAVYLGVVVALQGVLGSLTADSDLAVAGSTLTVAALFGSLRSRVQAFIDRRFNRRKYDAQRTLEQFTSRLRENVDLDHLARDLVAVVQDTMQPTQASVWLRP